MSTSLLPFVRYRFITGSKPQYLKRKYLSYLRIHYPDRSARGPGTKSECVAAVAKTTRHAVEYANSVSVEGKPLMTVLEYPWGTAGVTPEDCDDYAWQLVAAWDKSVLQHRMDHGWGLGKHTDREAKAPDQTDWVPLDE